jgi:competence protein ComEC
MSSPTLNAPSDARPYEPLVAVLAAGCGGILLDRYWPQPFLIWWWLATTVLIIWYFFWKHAQDRAACFALLIAIGAMGGAWHHYSWFNYRTDEVGLFAPDEKGPVALRVAAVTSPRRVPPPPRHPTGAMAASERSRLEISVSQIRVRDVWHSVSGSMTLVVQGNLVGVSAGDGLEIVGQFGRFQPPDNPGQFDYAARARADGRLTYVTCEVPDCVRRHEASRQHSLMNWIDQILMRSDRQLWRHVSLRRAGLASAMFLGVREELEPDEFTAFMETGAVHLLVVSGLNVAILAVFLFALMRLGWLPERWALLLIATITVIYALMTNLQPPVVRSAIMVLIYCVAQWLGRRPLAFNCLAAAALLVLAMNPSELFQVGTQFSFLSFAVLIWVGQQMPPPTPRDPLDRLIYDSRPWYVKVPRAFVWQAWRAFVTSVVICAVITPLQLSKFHMLTPIAVVLGPLLSPVVTVSMLSGLGVVVFGVLMPPLARLCGLICDGTLWFMQRCVAWGQQLPFGHIWSPGPAVWWIAGFYAAIILWTFAPQLAPPRRWRWGLLAAWIGLGFQDARWQAPPPDELRCNVLSVGHGTAVVLELPGGKTMLYDAGRLGSPVMAARQIADFLWWRGIRHLDGMILSHADTDHFCAVPDLLNRFPCDTVYVSPVMFEGQHSTLKGLKSAIEHSHAKLQVVWSGDRLKSGGATLEILHPPRTGVLGTDNANSIVVLLDYQGRRLMFTGDLEDQGMRSVLAEEPTHLDLLLAPHHGSARSNPPGMTQWSSPNFVAISGGRQDRHPDVLRAYAARGAQVLHTSHTGLILAHIAGGEMEIGTYRQ